MLAFYQNGIFASCHSIWDSVNAQPSPCAKIYLSVLPIIVIALAVANAVSAHFGHRWRPKWSRPFISELQPVCLELSPTGGNRQFLGGAVVLFALSVLGFAAKLTQVIPPRPDLTAVLPLVSWATAALLIAIRRPRSIPTSMLAYFLVTLATELLMFAGAHNAPLYKTVAHYVAAGAAVAATVTVLRMSCRDPALPSVEISSVGQDSTCSLRSPEDNLRLWQFLTVSWMGPLMSTGRNRTLHEEDVWLLPFEFQHRGLHEKFRQLWGSVLSRLFQANGIDVIIIAAIAVVQMLCDFSTPVLLQQLLQAVQDPAIPKRVAITYASLSLVVRLVSTQIQVLNLWYGRRCYERTRGEMVMMVYEKALSRKNVFGVELQSKQVMHDSPDGTFSNGQVSRGTAPTKSWYRRLCSVFFRRRGRLQQPVKEAASMGKIFNLLRGDVYEVAQRFWEVDALVDKPLGMIVATVLVWKLFGPSCLLAILAVLVAQVLNAIVTRILLRWERVRRAATDARLQVTSQFVEALRHLRWYGWENHWLKQVMEARHRELMLRIATNLWVILIRFINTFASGVFPVVALYSYTLLTGHKLRIDIIFPALQLFNMWETRLVELPGLITSLINASIALGRIEGFMAEPNKEGVAVGPRQRSSSFRLESCSFAWSGKISPVLSDLNLTFPTGLTVIYGKVGTGKTALLQALLGELDQISGIAHVPDEMVGYCAQSPWLQSMSIRDNILFSSPYDERRYKRVLDACALLPDLADFKHGDLSFMGENGVGLSGGQKARVALARAVYSRARILFLDDPLSALDHNTAETVVRKCFTGTLAQDRVIVLATHRTMLVRPIANQMIQVSNGTVVLSAAADVAGSTTPDDEDSEQERSAVLDDEAAAVPDKFIEEEHRAEFGVKARVYWSYIQAGKLKWWAVLVVVLALYRMGSVGQSWFLKEWGEAYGDQVHLVYAFIGAREISGLDWSTWPSDLFDKLPPPFQNVRPWLWAFFAITTFQSVALLVAQLFMLVIVYCAGRTMFQEVMARVSHATFRFFDVTPVGRLMNRLTSDIGVVDGNISEQFQAMAFHAITWISSILVIASVTPGFLFFSFALTVAFVFIFLLFLPTSQSLRRLEMVSLSPLLSNFGELLHGLTTVRAFRAETRFQDRVIAVVDKFQGMDHFYWSLQSWLMYRFEGLSAISTFCLTALALYTNISPGLIAFLLIAANNFVLSTHALCKQYGQLQMDFVSVERVDELRHIEEESPGIIDPPASWPKYGKDIIFEDVTIRYSPQSDPSLENVSLRIPGGSTTAVIGRTGSGKSTLAVSLLGVVRPEVGRITVDDVDIAQANTRALRTRVTFVAQDPVLFPGDIRVNLDPIGEYSDHECSEVLDRVCSRHHWTLQTHIEAGGRNLSQGQRQLIGLARTILRASPIVVLDEATASVDHETSLEIQQIIREELKQSTVITIAHRLEAIKDAEYYVVLDRGRVSKQGYVEQASTG